MPARRMMLLVRVWFCLLCQGREAKIMSGGDIKGRSSAYLEPRNHTPVRFSHFLIPSTINNNNKDILLLLPPSSSFILLPIIIALRCQLCCVSSYNNKPCRVSFFFHTILFFFPPLIPTYKTHTLSATHCFLPKAHSRGFE
ncbi:hypothetical protein V8C26DRAFT_109374 [Trichoderma gracile]